MNEQAAATFRAGSWEEIPFAEAEGLPRMTKVTCKQTYEGEVEGTSTLEYLMVYSGAERATFVGLERIVGKLAGREGSFVLEHRGVYEGGVAKMELVAVEGAATGELEGLRARAQFESAHAEQYSITFDYEL